MVSDSIPETTAAFFSLLHELVAATCNNGISCSSQETDNRELQCTCRLTRVISQQHSGALSGCPENGAQGLTFWC